MGSRLSPKEGQFLEAIRLGVGRTEAARLANVHPKTPYDWQRRHPHFRAALERAELPQRKGWEEMKPSDGDPVPCDLCRRETSGGFWRMEDGYWLCRPCFHLREENE